MIPLGGLIKEDHAGLAETFFFFKKRQKSEFNDAEAAGIFRA